MYIIELVLGAVLIYVYRQDLKEFGLYMKSRFIK